MISKNRHLFVVLVLCLLFSGKIFAIEDNSFKANPEKYLLGKTLVEKEQGQSILINDSSYGCAILTFTGEANQSYKIEVSAASSDGARIGAIAYYQDEKLKTLKNMGWHKILTSNYSTIDFTLSTDDLNKLELPRKIIIYFYRSNQKGQLKINDIRIQAKVKTKPLPWHEGFEDFEVGEICFEPWATNGKYTVNYNGVTVEKVFSGKKAYKLDVTFTEGTYFYWSLPGKFPAEGKAKFSAQLMLGESTTGRAGIGINYYFPPTTHSGCGPMGEYLYYSEVDGTWKHVQGDIISRAEESVRIAQQHIALAEAENIGCVVDRVGIFLRGEKGQRVVLYVDDIRIDGEVPDAKDYAKVVEQRWAPIKNRLASEMADLRQTLTTHKTEVESMNNLSPVAQHIVSMLKERLAELETMLSLAIRKSWFRPHEYQELKRSFEPLAAIVAGVRELDASGITFEDAIVYALENPMLNTPIRPDDKLVAGKLATEVRVVAAQNEFESFSLVVQALRDLNELTLKVSDLTEEQNAIVIPADAVDVRVVKCWYQAGSAWVGIGQNRTKRVLIPELLLHDDALVRVDEKEQKNYLRLSFTDGDKYWYSEDPKYKNVTGMTILPTEDFPIYDAKMLQPLNLGKNRIKQYWLTLHVPPATQAGMYVGTVKVLEGENEISTVSLRVRVLPFALPMPKTHYDLEVDFISSIYYRGKYNAQKFPNGSVSSEYKSEQQLLAELVDMWNHNIHNPTVYQGFDGMDTYMRLRNEVGMKGLPLFSLGTGVGNFTTPEKLRDVQERLKRMRVIAEAHGAPEMYIYGIDEAKGEMLLSQRKTWQAVHEVGVKMFVAGYKGYFEQIGDLLDMQVQEGVPIPEEAKMWHNVGHKILCYANPQTGPEDPEVFRRNFGLYLWLADYDGAMTYCYQHSFGNIYDDFDQTSYRDHVFSYPTADGVIPTLAIEGYREGIDDVRYATLLKQLIAKNSRGDKASVAKKADAYLESLDTSRNLGTIRLEIIDHILALWE